MRPDVHIPLALANIYTSFLWKNVELLEKDPAMSMSPPPMVWLNVIGGYLLWSIALGLTLLEKTT